jgi:hypothetical protein
MVNGVLPEAARSMSLCRRRTRGRGWLNLCDLSRHYAWSLIRLECCDPWLFVVLVDILWIVKACKVNTRFVYVAERPEFIIHVMTGEHLFCSWFFCVIILCRITEQASKINTELVCVTERPEFVISYYNWWTCDVFCSWFFCVIILCRIIVRASKINTGFVRVTERPEFLIYCYDWWTRGVLSSCFCSLIIIHGRIIVRVSTTKTDSYMLLRGLSSWFTVKTGEHVVCSVNDVFSLIVVLLVICLYMFLIFYVELVL